jgi:hypothetical protein
MPSESGQQQDTLAQQEAKLKKSLEEEANILSRCVYVRAFRR